MKRYVVIGNPVAHSRSPFIHTAFARQTGIELRYERLPCADDEFATTLDSFAASGGAGCNVTLPFKPEAFDLAGRRTPRAELAGACNTLRLDDDGWSGDNTDGAGLLRDIETNAGVGLRGARVLLIGAGGAAAGVLGPLLASGAAAVVVANRSETRAQSLVGRHASSGNVASNAAASAMASLSAAPLEACGTAFDVVINASASSVAGAPIPVSAATLRPGSLALDLMYGPPAHAFLRWAEASGATARDGLGMLVEQAAEAFVFFHGVRPETLSLLAEMRARVDA